MLDLEVLSVDLKPDGNFRPKSPEKIEVTKN